MVATIHASRIILPHRFQLADRLLLLIMLAALPNGLYVSGSNYAKVFR